MMKRRTAFCVIIMLLSCAFTSFSKTERTVSAVELKCNYQKEPLGIDDAVPQLSWQIGSNYQNVMQSAYRILVADSEEMLERDNANVWDSGKMNSSASVGIAYGGPQLRSSTRYYWKVRVWTEDGIESDWSQPTFFETALLNQSDWRDGWVGYAAGMPGRVLYFKGTISCNEEIRKAKMYVSGLGFNRVEINHERVGKNVLDPAQSTYSKRAYYSSYDVTSMLRQPDLNTIVITVAPGWYGTPKLRFQMEITYASGRSEVYTANNMRAITTGPIMTTTVFDGEHYDAREENPETYVPCKPEGLMNKVWGLAYNTDEPVGKMVSQQVEPIMVMDSFEPQSISEPLPGVYVVDAGRNLAGWASIRVKNMGGKKVVLRYAETLRENGLVNQDNLRNAKVEDSFVPADDEPFEWEPEFTYHGFRFIQVEGLETPLSKEDISIKVVCSSVAQTGHFECSDELLNKINTMVLNTEASNLHSVPTDCPQRDERMGWLNDLTVRIEQAVYNFDMARFYPKFFLDIVDTQYPDGTITCVAPYRFGNRPADPVSASFLLLAYECYKFYGNRNLITTYFDNMKGWVDYLYSRTDNGIVNYSYYGDWCPPKEFLVNEYAGVSKDTPGLMISTGYLYYCAKILSEMAVVAGRESDAKKYSSMAEEIGAAFNREYWHEDVGGYGTNNQSSNSFALYIGLVPEERCARVAKNLADNVAAHDYHLTTGNLCTKYLLEMLTEHGYKDVAYKVASQTTYPGWGYMIEKGATTLWERWEYLTGDAMNSHNHPMMGSVGSWFYKYLAGIKPDFAEPGFSHFTIKPYVVDNLSYVNCEYETVKGTIKSSWEKKGKTLYMNISVPANTKATVYVPGAKGYTVKEVGSGDYSYKTRL